MHLEINSTRNELLSQELSASERDKSTQEYSKVQTLRSGIQEHFYSRPSLHKRLLRRGGGGRWSGIAGRGADIFTQEVGKVIHSKEAIVHTIVEFVGKIT